MTKMKRVFMTLIGHLQSWPRKADYLSFGVQGWGSFYFLRWKKKQIPKPLTMVVGLAYQRKLLLSDCT